ncbi:MAG TPA: RNA polymerase sigma factor [Ardenticatenaceae bacterium]|nr:RNA polymerase sigma factor [Ardenticatenaceae bacterium]
MSEEAWAVPRMRDDPDFDLVRAMAAGDSQALESLYARHGPGLLTYLVAQLGQRAVAEEVLQDVMLAAWNGAAHFRGDSQVRTWLLSIARHRAANARRRRTPGRAPLDEETLVAGDPHPSTSLEQQEKRGSIRRALTQLSEEQRETLELVFFHELSGDEVALVTGVALGTVKSRLHRAKAALRKLLEREEAGNAR